MNGSKHIQYYQTYSDNIYSQRYTNNIKRGKLKENQPGTLKIYAFCQKIQQTALGPRDSAAGITYLSMRIQPKS